MRLSLAHLHNVQYLELWEGKLQKQIADKKDLKTLSFSFHNWFIHMKLTPDCCLDFLFSTRWAVCATRCNIKLYICHCSPCSPTWKCHQLLLSQVYLVLGKKVIGLCCHVISSQSLSTHVRYLCTTVDKWKCVYS